MGLASALAAQAANQGPPAAYGAPPQQYQQGGYPGGAPQQQPGSYPAMMQGPGPQAAAYPSMAPAPYPAVGGAAPPGMPGYPGYPPQQQPMMQQQQQPQQQGMASVVAAKLAKIVAANQLQAFYPPDKLAALTARVMQRVDFHSLAARWRMPVELAIDLAALALYDVVIYGDDSGSMESENGERIKDLELIMAKVAEVATLFDEDGIEVRFINSDAQGNGIKSGSDASRLLQRLEYRWDTKLATQLEAKILGPMAYARQLAKPLLVITITDGEPSDKPQDKIVSVIQECRARLAPRYGPNAVAFQFAQVGKDREAQEFLSHLDKHPQVGKMIDCTSYFELEQAEYAAKGIQLSVEAWLVKLMVGALDPEYDEQDEAAGPAHANPPQGAYGYPPPQQQQQQYGAGGYPPSGYPQQQQGGYPQQQQPGGYYGGQQQPHKPHKQGFFSKLFS